MDEPHEPLENAKKGDIMLFQPRPKSKGFVIPGLKRLWTIIDIPQDRSAILGKTLIGNIGEEEQKLGHFVATFTDDVYLYSKLAQEIPHEVIPFIFEYRGVRIVRVI